MLGVVYLYVLATVCVLSGVLCNEERKYLLNKCHQYVFLFALYLNTETYAYTDVTFIIKIGSVMITHCVLQC